MYLPITLMRSANVARVLFAGCAGVWTESEYGGLTIVAERAVEKIW